MRAHEGGRRPLQVRVVSGECDTGRQQRKKHALASVNGVHIVEVTRRQTSRGRFLPQTMCRMQGITGEATSGRGRTVGRIVPLPPLAPSSRVRGHPGPNSETSRSTTMGCR